MDELKALLSIVFFCVSAYLVYDLFASGFDIKVLIGVFLFYTLAYICWPSDRKKKEDLLDFFDILEFIVQVPYRAISLLIRMIGRSNKDGGGFDIDV